MAQSQESGRSTPLAPQSDQRVADTLQLGNSRIVNVAVRELAQPLVPNARVIGDCPQRRRPAVNLQLVSDLVSE